MVLLELLEPALFGIVIGIPLGLIFANNSDLDSRLILPISFIVSPLLYYIFFLKN